MYCEVGALVRWYRHDAVGKTTQSRRCGTLGIGRVKDFAWKIPTLLDVRKFGK